MKKLLITLLILGITTLGYCADTKVSGLDDISSPATGDDMYVVDDPDVTPASKKISIGALLGVANDLDTSGDIVAGAVGASELSSTSVTAGSYMTPTVTVDADGRITMIASGSLTGLSDIGSATQGAGRLLISDGVNFDSIALSNAVSLNSDGTTTIDGEYITNDTIDDDSIDFGDVTCVDITTSDCGAITSSSTISATGDIDTYGTYEAGTSHVTITTAAGNLIGEVIDNDSIDEDSIDWGTGADQISIIDLPDVGSATQTAGNLLISDGTDFQSIALSGDATLAGTGVLTISNDAVTYADLVITGGETDEYCLSYESDGTTMEWKDCSGGGGGGDFVWFINPQQAKLPASNSMTIDAGNGRWRGLFDADTAECAEWSTIVQPLTGTLKTKLVYSMVSGTANEVEFELSVMCITGGDSADVDTDSFGSVDNLSGTVPGTAGYPAVLADTSLQGDSCAAGDLMIVKICRDADDATNDDATGDAEFRGAVIYAE